MKGRLAIAVDRQRLVAAALVVGDVFDEGPPGDDGQARPSAGAAPIDGEEALDLRGGEVDAAVVEGATLQVEGVLGRQHVAVEIGHHGRGAEAPHRLDAAAALEADDVAEPGQEGIG